MVLVELLRSRIAIIGEEREAAKTGLAGVVDGGGEEAGAYPLAAMFGMDDHVFQPADRAALGGADGEEEADHAANFRPGAGDEDEAGLR